MNTKRAWRKWAAALGQPPTAEQNSAVVSSLLDLLSVHPGRVLTYEPMKSELDLGALAARLDPSRLLLTRTPPSGPLTIHDFDSMREQHRYGFSQPVADSAAREVEEVSVVLVPGVLFAHDGVRLGHGRGYYDELLSRTLPGTVRVGITLDSRLVRSLPATERDMAMTHLASELGVAELH